MPDIEAITVLAVVEAQDKASSLLEGIFGALTRTADSFRAAGEAADLSGRMMDAGLMSGATAAERLSIADEQLTSAQDLAWESSQKLRAAQVELGMAIETDGLKSKAAAAAQEELRVAQIANTTASGFLKDATEAHAAAQAEVTAHTNGLKGALDGTLGVMTSVGGATALAAGYSVKLAGDFQQQTQTFVAGAGVQQSQIDGVRQQILKLATDTGTSTKSLNDAFFQVKSRMDSVSDAETVMSDAAELAKIHNADLNTVAVALASSLNAYAGTGLDAASASNILGVAVEKGGMSFQELSGSLSTVLPKAKEAGLSFAQVTAAVATMTGSGQSAQQATQDLAHTIGKLQSPTAEMISTWNQLGLTQKQVSDALHGPGGLEAAMNLIADTAKSKIGPGGQVVIDTFKKSQDAGNALKQMLQSMAPDAAKLAQALENGSISSKDYTKAAKELSGASADQATQFKNLFDKANGFNDAVKAGKPGFSDFSALLKSSYGDATSMQTALLLGGTAAQKWTDITKEATAAGQDSKNGIQGWAAVQGTLNQKMNQAKEAFQVAAITLGTALLPPVIKLIQEITPWLNGLAQLIQKHQEAAKILIAVGLAIGAVGAALKITIGFVNLFKDAAAIFKGMKTAITELELGTKLVSAATKIWSGIQAAFNAIMAMNPIMLVVIAIGLLVAAAIYAFYHFKGFHDFVMASWTLIKEAGVGLWHMLEAAFKGIASAAKAVWDFLVGVFNGIVGAVTSFGSTVWGAITSVWNAISDFFKKWWPLLLVIFAFPIAVLMSIWNHFHTQITEVVTSVWNFIKKYLGELWDGIKILAQLAWEYIKNFIIDPVIEVWHGLEALWGYIKEGASAAWNWLAGVANSAWQGIKRYIIQPISEVLDWIGSNLSKIGSWFADTFNGILNWLGGIGSSFVSVGEDIVNGITSGVENAGGWLMDKLKNLANSALNAAKSFLGIGSPSKEFANQVGQWIPHGIAQGVNDHAQTAIDAVTGLATALPQAIGVQGSVNIGTNGVNAAGSTFATGLGLGVPAASAKGAGDLHVHVDLRDAVVAGDRGMEDLINKMGNAIATRILPQAGVRIRA